MASIANLVTTAGKLCDLSVFNSSGVKLRDKKAKWRYRSLSKYLRHRFQSGR